MNITEAVAALDGRQYRDEGTALFFSEMKGAGLVAVFGASDDLIEFRGAINDEQGAGHHSTHSLNRGGLLHSDCREGIDCPYFQKQENLSAFVEALWGVDGLSWRYKLVAPDGSTIEHAKFVILDDDDQYCEGIVFALADIPA